MINRLITVSLSVILLAVIFSWVTYEPMSQREPNVYYFGFFETFVFVIIYSAPVYFLIGLPISILIDKIIGTFNLKSKLAYYFSGLGLYSFAGLLIGIILLMIVNRNIDLYILIPVLICCLVAALIYFHCFLLVSKIMRNRLLNND